MLSQVTAFILKNAQKTREEVKADSSLIAENISDIVNVSENWSQQIKSSTVARKIIGEAELTDANSSSVPIISSHSTATHTLSDGGFFQSAVRVSQGDFLRNKNNLNEYNILDDLRANFESHYNIADDIAYGNVDKYKNLGIYGFSNHPYISRSASSLADSFADTTDAQDIVSELKKIVHAFIDGINSDANQNAIAISRQKIEIRMDTATLNQVKRIMTEDSNNKALKVSVYEELVKYFEKSLGLTISFIEDTGTAYMPLVLKGGTYRVMILGLISKKFVSYENPYGSHLIGGKNAITQDASGNNVLATFTSMQLGLDVKRKDTVEIWEV